MPFKNLTEKKIRDFECPFIPTPHHIIIKNLPPITDVYNIQTKSGNAAFCTHRPSFQCEHPHVESTFRNEQFRGNFKIDVQHWLS